jgi:hypothetical protein
LMAIDTPSRLLRACGVGMFPSIADT